MSIFLQVAVLILAISTACLALLYSATKSRATRFLAQLEKAESDRDFYMEDRNRLLKRVAALNDELHAVPNLPDPVAALRDMAARFKRIGGML